MRHQQTMSLLALFIIISSCSTDIGSVQATKVGRALLQDGSTCDVTSGTPNACFNADGTSFICCGLESCPASPGPVALCASNNAGSPPSITGTPAPTDSTSVPVSSVPAPTPTPSGPANSPCDPNSSTPNTCYNDAGTTFVCCGFDSCPSTPGPEPRCASPILSSGTPTPTPTTSATGPPSAIAPAPAPISSGAQFPLNSDGGKGEILGLIEVTFPSGSVSGPVTGKLLVGGDVAAVAEEAFGNTADFFDPTSRYSDFITVQVGPDRPLQDVQVKLTVPAGSGLSTGPLDEARLMFFNMYTDLDTPDAGEILETIEIAEERGVTAAGSSFTSTLPRSAFHQLEDNAFGAHLLLVTTETGGNGGSRRRMLGALEMPGGHLRGLLQAAGKCDGVSLTPPVPNLLVTSKFGPRPGGPNGDIHYGVDLRAPLGTQVVAAQDGTITVDREVNKKTGALKGYGYHVIIKGAAGTTLYGHMMEGSAPPTGTKVKAGDPIGKSGISGLPPKDVFPKCGPHLHLDYAPPGKLFVKANKVDPAPCLQASVAGSLSIGDNGPAADDSFSVSLAGSFICQTSIGASNNCALGALKPGTYKLDVQCLVAPDDDGTLGISVNESGFTLCLSAGNCAKSFSLDLTQSQTVSFSLIVATP